MPTTRPEVRAEVENVDLSNARIVVTGATDGIGRETALALGRLGADLIVQGRSADKAEDLVAEIRATPGSAEYCLGDFLAETAVHEVADTVLDRWDGVDVLINNAGTHFGTGKLTESGVERTFAVNHLAPFILTNRLAPALERARGRIVNVASQVHRRANFDIAAMTSVAGYDGFEAYSRSKFANILFTHALARHLESATANSLHPGFVPGTELWRSAGLGLKLLMRTAGALPAFLQNMVGKTPAAAASTPVYLAASSEVAAVTGAYFSDREQTEPAPRTRNEDLQERLWKRSAEHISMDRTDLVADGWAADARDG